MERDFMGLSSKESLAVVKNKKMNSDGCKDSGFMKCSMVQWPFSNKLMGSGPITSAGEQQMVSVSNQAISVSMGQPFLKSHFATVGQSMNGANVKQPLLGGIPVTAPHSSVLPISGAVTGMTESCVKPSAPSRQLTIFYAGTVNVFNDISPEKAQAIMLLAGNGFSAASNMLQPKIQPLNLKLATGDGVPVSQPINTPPGSGISSPLSVSSHTIAQSGSGSSSTDEHLAAKTTGTPAPSVCKAEPPKVVKAAAMLPSAVPQARKASLARFLEKRKERAMNVAPYNYNLNKKSEGAPLQNTMVANFSASIGTNTVSTKQG